MKRALAAAGILACSLSCLPSAMADGDRPSRESYAAALVAAYEENLLAMGATEAQTDEFGECLLEGTYEQMSAEAVQAIADEDMDYVLEDEDADIFLDATEVCLEQSELADLVLDDAGVDSAGDSTASDADAVAAPSDAADTHSTDTLDASGPAAGADTSAEASDSASWRLPAAVGLLLLALIGAAAYLVVANRARAEERRERLATAEDTSTGDMFASHE